MSYPMAMHGRTACILYRTTMIELAKALHTWSSHVQVSHKETSVQGAPGLVRMS